MLFVNSDSYFRLLYVFWGTSNASKVLAWYCIPPSSFTLSVSVYFCICVAILLASGVLFTLSHRKCRQTSKQIISNAQCEWALSLPVLGHRWGNSPILKHFPWSKVFLCSIRTTLCQRKLPYLMNKNKLCQAWFSNSDLCTSICHLAQESARPISVLAHP